jgi:SAM-dependent methyltransferase
LGEQSATADGNLAVWERDADRYAPSLALHVQEQDLLGRLRERWPELAMLDLGVGAGRTAYTFAPLARTYVGIDYSQPMVDLARTRVVPREGVRFEHGDARDLARFRATPFDIVLFSYNGIDSVSHADRVLIFEQVFEVLAPDGLFLFSSHSMDALPLASPLPRPRGRLTARSAYRLARGLPAALKIRRQNDRLDLAADRRRGWVAVPDDVYDVGMENLYVLASAQVAELARLGFEVCEVTDRRGRAVDPRRPGRDAWLHYLCRRPG